MHAYVQKFPTLKEMLKKIYQFPFVVFSRNKQFTKLVFRIEDAFLGFHDVSPWCRSGKKLLIHQSKDRSRKKIKAGDSVEICLVCSDTQKIETIASTEAFNWQQGSRAQWVGNSNHLVFNTLKGKSLVASKYCAETKAFSTIPAPVYSIDHSGEKFISTNFSIIEKFMPGYGYVGEFKEPDNFGSFSVRWLKDGQIDLHIGFEELKAEIPDLSRDNYFVSHFQFSPTDQKLAFFIRTQLRKNWYATKFIMLDLHLRKLKVFDDVTGATHFAWINDAQVLVFMKHGRLSKFCFVDVKTNKIEASPVFNGLLDGHPFVAGNKVIIDSYPDKKRRQNLYLYDIDDGSLRYLFNVYAPFKYSGYHRIDLHPKINKASNLVAFDAGDLGRQSVCISSL